MRARLLCESDPVPGLTELPALGMDAASPGMDFRRHYSHTLGQDKHCKSAHYTYEALVLTLRNRLMERWKRTKYAWEEQRCKRAYYPRNAS